MAHGPKVAGTRPRCLPSLSCSDWQVPPYLELMSQSVALLRVDNYTQDGVYCRHDSTAYRPRYLLISGFKVQVLGGSQIARIVRK